ncbi:MAG: head GIN domain-containing protein [Chloroflexota bacterium]
MSPRKLAILLSLAIVLGSAALVTGCNVVTGSGKVVTWEMDYRDFTNIEAGYAFDVDVRRGDDFLVRIDIDENLYEYLNISQTGDTLHIGLKSNALYTDTTQRATITLPELRRLELSGAAEGKVSGFTTTRKMHFELSGASKLSLDHVKAGDVNLELSGASDVTGTITMKNGGFDLSGASSIELEGSADDVTIEASGASNIILPVFTVLNADLQLSGASEAVINASNRMDIDLSGASDIKYLGNPKLGRINVSGASTIGPK